MPYPTRTPSVKLNVDIEVFNNLIERLTINELTKEYNEDFALSATKLKEKLLTYSVPRTDDNGETTIDIRFYPNEASNIITQLVVSDTLEKVETDYYAVLLKVREERMKQRNQN
ncbi:MAG: hypothetical protein RSE41_00660 [Clostridia bacterium]